MPELPEVETIVRGLEPVLVGQRVEEVKVLLAKTVWVDAVRATGMVDTGNFISLVKGKTISSVSRRAKMIIVGLSDDTSLLVHLKMTGQLIYVAADGQGRVAGGHPTQDMVGELPSKSTRVILRLSDGGVLYFNDQRQFGYMKIVTTSSLTELEPLRSYGPEPLSDEFTVEVLRMACQRRKKIKIKQLLLDQTVIAGIGNIYADESLFGAKIYPGRSAGSLTEQEMVALHREIVAVLKLSLSHGGTSSEHYVNADGIKGNMQDYLLVYRRAGEVCPVCGSEIERTVIGGRGTHYCPHCQPVS